MVPTYGYWNMRGLGESVRYLLYYTGIKFNDKRYQFGPADNWDTLCKEWFDEKFTLGLDFPNLPYYIDDDVKLTQSTVILKYLARKHGLIITTPEKEILKQEIVEHQAIDLRTSLFRLSHNKNFEEEKPFHVRDMAGKVKMFSDFLGNKKWMMGDKLTYVDFLIYEAIDLWRFLVPDCLEEFSNLKAYMARFESIPAIAEYMKSDTFVRWPILSPFATYGGK